MMLTVKISATQWQGSAKKQQDAMLVATTVVQEKQAIIEDTEVKGNFIVAVSDGLASASNAENASKTLLEGIHKNWLQSNGNKPVSLTTVNDYLCDKLARKSPNSACTLAMLQYGHQQSNEIVIRHVGDSRIYHFQAQRWQSLTQDHTFSHELGLNENDDLADCYSVLTEYFIADSLSLFLHVSSKTIKAKTGDVFLLCTDDGVHDILACEKWGKFTQKQSPKNWLNQLKEMIYKQGAYDNASAILLEVININNGTTL